MLPCVVKKNLPTLTIIIIFRFDGVSSIEARPMFPVPKYQAPTPASAPAPAPANSSNSRTQSADNARSS